MKLPHTIFIRHKTEEIPYTYKSTVKIISFYFKLFF